ncbi:4'-phosphopantetheinyl transferase superfamily protein [Streptomyces sp. NPDC048506]|uniref:4'-phosphopantetheinyl transferase family protein n=1 Tax=Streptomyces sp. NPDC048506 TaxID=3155028 RepID=UPI003440F116
MSDACARTSPTAPDDRLLVLLAHTAERHPAGAPLLRAAAGAVLGVPADEVVVGREPSGRPVLGGAARGLHASVSHVPGLSAVAIGSRGPVGVDVERLRALPAAALARRWFGAGEAGWLAGRPEAERPVQFLRLWTQKEAIGKVLGTGLSDGGLLRPVRLGAPAGTVLHPVPGVPRFYIALPPAPEGFVLAVAGGPEAAGSRLEVLMLPPPAARPDRGAACPSRSGETGAARTSGSEA